MIAHAVLQALRGSMAGRSSARCPPPNRSINCMHILPDLAYVERKYAGAPFAVVSADIV